MGTRPPVDGPRDDTALVRLRRAMELAPQLTSPVAVPEGESTDTAIDTRDSEVSVGVG